MQLSYCKKGEEVFILFFFLKVFGEFFSCFPFTRGLERKVIKYWHSNSSPPKFFRGEHFYHYLMGFCPSVKGSWEKTGNLDEE